MSTALARLRFPPMTRIHQPIALWFRAIFLIRNSQSISSIALGERLELEQRLAWKLGRTIRRMRADYPEPHPTHRKWARSSGACGDPGSRPL